MAKRLYSSLHGRNHQDRCIALRLVVEAIAALVIGVGVFQLLIRYIPTRLSKNHHIDTATLRVKFGSSLTLALALLLAADVLQTAVCANPV